MSTYTTGELAKRCDVTVRTVQYYDKRGVLTPDALSEGGRRVYSEASLRRLKVICFLRGLGLSIDAISQLLSEEHPENVIGLLLDQQQEALRQEVAERQEQLDRLSELKKELKSAPTLSIETIGDIAYNMTNRNNLKRVHRNLLIWGVPLNLLQAAGILLWILKGNWVLFAVWLAVVVPAGILLTRYYFRNVAYICPECHSVFVPSLRDAFFARHTPSTRKLTCTSCGHHGFCVETFRGDGDAQE